MADDWRDDLMVIAAGEIYVDKLTGGIAFLLVANWDRNHHGGETLSRVKIAWWNGLNFTPNNEWMDGKTFQRRFRNAPSATYPSRFEREVDL